jgi:hypothetical protein
MGAGYDLTRLLADELGVTLPLSDAATQNASNAGNTFKRGAD